MHKLRIKCYKLPCFFFLFSFFFSKLQFCNAPAYNNDINSRGENDIHTVKVGRLIKRRDKQMQFMGYIKSEKPTTFSSQNRIAHQIKKTRVVKHKTIGLTQATFDISNQMHSSLGHPIIWTFQNRSILNIFLKNNSPPHATVPGQQRDLAARGRSDGM